MKKSIAALGKDERVGTYTWLMKLDIVEQYDSNRDFEFTVYTLSCGNSQ